MIGTENLGIDFDDIDEEKQEEVAAEMLVHDTVIALVADPKACKSFCLIKITEEEKEKTEYVQDVFGHAIKKRMKHLEGVFLERKFNSDNLYTVPKKPKSAFCFRESLVFSSVQL